MARATSREVGQAKARDAETKTGLKEFSISTTEANADPQRLLRRVRPGRAACITRYGKPYVYLLTADADRFESWPILAAARGNRWSRKHLIISEQSGRLERPEQRRRKDVQGLKKGLF